MPAWIINLLLLAVISSVSAMKTGWEAIILPVWLIERT
jgi:hypothetical protein